MCVLDSVQIKEASHLKINARKAHITSHIGTLTKIKPTIMKIQKAIQVYSKLS